MTEIQIWMSIFTGIIAFLGFVIAYRQWRTAQNKLKLELFERRLQVYEAVDKLIVAYMRRFGDRDTAEAEFNVALRSARWLFDKHVVIFCRETIWKAVCDMNDIWEEVDRIRKSLNEQPDPKIEQMKSAGVKKVLEQKKKLIACRQKWEDTVTPYMSLRFK